MIFLYRFVCLFFFFSYFDVVIFYKCLYHSTSINTGNFEHFTIRALVINNTFNWNKNKLILNVCTFLQPEYYRDSSEFLCVSSGNRHQLRILHAKLNHTGTYTLQATNPHGQIKALISLQVYSTGKKQYCSMEKKIFF